MIRNSIFTTAAVLAFAAQPLAAQEQGSGELIESEDLEAIEAADSVASDPGEAAADEALGEVMGMLGALFQAEPLSEAEQGRLPVATQVVDKIMPPGTLQEMMGSMFDSTLGPLMSAATAPTTLDLSEQLGMAAFGLDLSEEQLGEVANTLDPARTQRNERVAEIFPSLMKNIMSAMEPGMRRAMSEVYAIHFTDKELADIDAFFSTESGLNYARKSFAMTSDPRILGASMEAMPAIMSQMASMEAKIAEATADLPAPKTYDELSAADVARLTELTGLSADELKEAMAEAASERVAVEPFETEMVEDAVE